MEFMHLIRTRRSVRSFKPERITQDQLTQILDSARLAPSAGNLQAYEIYVVRNEQKRKELSRAAYGQDFIAAAPVALVFCAHPALSAPRYGSRGVKLYAIQDATIACTFAMLAVHDLGLATVWVGSFDDREVQNVIGAPEGHIPVAILPIGYAAEIPEPRSRRPPLDLVHEV